MKLFDQVSRLGNQIAVNYTLDDAFFPPLAAHQGGVRFEGKTVLSPAFMRKFVYFRRNRVGRHSTNFRLKARLRTGRRAILAKMRQNDLSTICL
jgi:hypothetical protein